MFSNSRLSRNSASVIPLGFILVVTIITLALIIFHTTTLPALSKDSEIDAHQDVETDFIRMDSAVYQVATTGIPQPVVMGNRIQYPPSVAPIKTPTPMLRTEGPHTASFDNAIFTENATEFNETRETNSILFNRDYNYYTTARDFGYEHGVFYTQPPNGTLGEDSILVRDKQTLINDDTINFISLEGDLSFSRPSPTQVSISADESEERHDTITNAAGEHLELVVPTRIPQAEWDALLDSEHIANGGHVTNISYEVTNPQSGEDDDVNYVIIEMEPGIEYDINLYTVDIEKY